MAKLMDRFGKLLVILMSPLLFPMYTASYILCKTLGNNVTTIYAIFGACILSGILMLAQVVWILFLIDTAVGL